MAPAAFVTPTFSTAFTTARPQSTTSSRPLRPATRAPPARIVCATPTTEKSGKKKAPLTFATDLKGNFVWTLRAAGAEDVDDVARLFATTYPRALVESFVVDSECCTVCEPSIKGRKEGEGYKSKIMGAVLVDVETEVKDPEKGMDGGTLQTASVMGTIVDDELPDSEGVRKKLLLGAMKKLKLKGVPRVTAYIEAPETTTVTFLKECMFKQTGSDSSVANMVCDLVANDPDPEKKMI